MLNIITKKSNFCLSLGVLEEAEFYNIDPLVRQIKEKIQSREARLKHPVSHECIMNE